MTNAVAVTAIITFLVFSPSPSSQNQLSCLDFLPMTCSTQVKRRLAMAAAVAVANHFPAG